jgi:hypothetical protein
VDVPRTALVRLQHVDVGDVRTEVTPEPANERLNVVQDGGSVMVLTSEREGPEVPGVVVDAVAANGATSTTSRTGTVRLGRLNALSTYGTGLVSDRRLLTTRTLRGTPPPGGLTS